MAKAGSGKKKEGKPPPKCKAILLCNQVIVDQLTQKGSVIGIFDTFAVKKFPGRTVPFQVFVQLTDGIGKYRIAVEVINLRDGKPLARAELLEADFADRASKQALIIPVPPLPLPHDGLYDFVVYANGSEIDRQQFRAHAIGDNRDAHNQAESPEDPKE